MGIDACGVWELCVILSGFTANGGCIEHNAWTLPQRCHTQTEMIVKVKNDIKSYPTEAHIWKPHLWSSHRLQRFITTSTASHVYYSANVMYDSEKSAVQCYVFCCPFVFMLHTLQNKMSPKWKHGPWTFIVVRNLMDEIFHFWYKSVRKHGSTMRGNAY